MITLLVDFEFIKKVRTNPKEMHWSQSIFEKVTDAEILDEGQDYVLTKTKFLAPKMIRYPVHRTEEIGDVCRMLTQFTRDEKSGDGEAYWSKIMDEAKESIASSYRKGDFAHEDYTLWMLDDTTKVFINFRSYPKGSFLMDLISAEMEVNVNQKRESGEMAYRNSIIPGYRLEWLTPQNRTITLDEMINTNPADRVLIKSASGIREIKISSLRDIDNLSYSGVSGTMEVRENYLGQLAVRNRLIFFKTALINCSIPYRKNS